MYWLMFLLAFGSVLAVDEFSTSTDEYDSDYSTDDFSSSEENDSDNDSEYDDISSLTGPYECKDPKPEDKQDALKVCKWISDIQYTNDGLLDGGLTMHIDPNLDFFGKRWWEIYPYHANLALWGHLNAGCPNSLEMTKRYIKWYIQHLCGNWKPDVKISKEDCPYPGVILDFWAYKSPLSSDIPRDMLDSTCPEGIEATNADNHKGHLCNFADSEDAYAGTFIGLIEAYLNEGGDLEFIKGERKNIEMVAEVMKKLTKKNGLTIAKKAYPVFYTMDNAETAWGLKAMARLERYLWSDEKQARKYDKRYSKMVQGINTSLYSKRKKMYLAAIGESVDPKVWYGEGGVTHQVWPELFGVSSSLSRSKRLMELLNENFPDWTKESQDGGFPWASVGLAAVKTGHCDWARQEVNWITKDKIMKRFRYPWTPSDAGWLLKVYVALNGGNHIADESNGGPAPHFSSRL